MTPAVAIPPALAARASRGEAWATWLAGLPRLAGGLLEDWALTPDGPVTHGECALVLPVRTPTGRAAVLKVTWPHWEAETEHIALRRWGGDGVVELLAADPHRFALLLERADTRDLGSLAVDEAVTVVADRYGRLHVPAPPQVPVLSTRVADWAARLHALPRSAPLPRRLVEQAASLARTFAADPATDGTLLHTDLHYANVLAAEREPWLVIDPKPLSGDPHYEVAPLLWNRWDEAVSSGDLRRALRRRLDLAVDVAGLDHDRARDWAIVRLMDNALWEIEDATARPGATADRALLTTAVAAAKAVQ